MEWGTNFSRNKQARGVGEIPTSTDDEPWLYGYATTQINDLGHESPASAITWISGVNPGNDTAPARRRKWTLRVDIQRAPQGVHGFRLWRTTNVHDVSTVGQQGAALYLVAEIPTGGQVEYFDGTPDNELGIELPDTLGTFPHQAQYAHVFKGTMFTDGGSDRSRVFYSAPLFIEQFPPQNFFILGDSTSGPVMGFKSTKNALVVFKRRGVYLIKGDPANGFYAETLTEDVGCASPRSIVEIPGVGTMFLSDDGPYVLEGALTRVTYIGGPISKFWNTEVNLKALLNARASRYMKDREIWILLPEGGDDRTSLGLVFHYAVGGWSVRRGYTFSCLTEGRDHRGYLYLGSYDTTTAAVTAGVHVYSHGYLHNATLGQTGGTTVNSKIESSWLNFGKRVTPYHVNIRALNTGRALTFEWHADRDVLTWLGPPDATVKWADSERKEDVWDTGVWDTAKWHPVVPVEVRLDPRFAGALEFQWRVTSSKLAVVGYDLVYVDPTDMPKRGIE
jgi:hypothetical protein